jgi:hypothetical protein
MFTWICEKCGGEVPPSMDACPRCAEAARATASPVPAAPQPETHYQPQAPAAPQAPLAPQAPIAAQPQAAPAPVPQPVPQTAFPAQAPHYHGAPAIGYMPPPEPKSTTLRDILVTVGVAVVLLGGAYWYLTREERALKAEEDKPALESVTAAKPHPLAKQLEVTGIRLRTPKPGQAEVQAVVVNHSAADIASLNMDVVLMAKGTTKEVAVFPVKLKKLGPFASTEVTARTKTQMSAIDLPDWQFLEAKVVIASDAP